MYKHREKIERLGCGLKKAVVNFITFLIHTVSCPYPLPSSLGVQHLPFVTGSCHAGLSLQMLVYEFMSGGTLRERLSRKLPSQPAICSHDSDEFCHGFTVIGQDV
jgi:hypothetical protein